MAWKKLGQIFNPNEHKIEWLKSHAMMPLPIVLNDRIRVYFTGRHNDGMSRVAFIDFVKENPTKILSDVSKPLLEVGTPGTFDDCGTVGTKVLKRNDSIYLYYNGYNVRNTVPWSNSIGLAVSNDGGTFFEKMFLGPILDRDPHEPYFAISPEIIEHDDILHMFYTSGTGWLNINDKREPIYDIKYATSTDGIKWERNYKACVPQNTIEECVARPTVVLEGEMLKMWFTFRGSRDFRDGTDSYRLGYAEANITSPTEWVRKDELIGINLGPEEYDNLMQAYPAVLDVGEKRYLFYNGNGFGYNGICLAVWE